MTTMNKNPNNIEEGRKQQKTGEQKSEIIHTIRKGKEGRSLRFLIGLGATASQFELRFRPHDLLTIKLAIVAVELSF